MTVTLQFQGDDLEVWRQLGQECCETALDRAHRAMQERERRAATVALVVHVKRADVDVTGSYRRRGHLGDAAVAYALRR